MVFTLQQILDTAASHSFYSQDVTSKSGVNLSDFPFLEKPTLYNRIESALKSDPGFLHGIYISPSGGTSGLATNMFMFITDTAENREQRRKGGEFMRDIAALNSTDIVLNLSGGQDFYRSSQLMGDLIEYAGGTNIPLSHATEERVISAAIQFRTNCVMGTASRLIILARYLLAHPEVKISFEKVLYSSEPLPVHQEEYMRSAFHCDSIVSIYGSAECGMWACSRPAKELNHHPYTEMVFETDTMVVEVVDDDCEPVADGGVGELVVTSLMRRRNPLVRYRTGDIGVLRPVGSNEADGTKYRTFLLYGRHPGKSFNITGEYFNVGEIEDFMKEEQWGVLEWQVILGMDGVDKETAEFRVVFKDQMAGVEGLEGFRKALWGFIGSSYLYANLGLKAVEYKDLEKGKIANKIRKIVNLRV